MKTIRKIKKGMSIFLLAQMITFTFQACAAPNPTPPPKKGSIKVALLLDTSNSMDGLIEQAKSQLWKVVNELALAKKDGENASLEIALYEYGNDRLNSETGYIRKVLPLTDDLDEISSKLFALSTNGGSEYCGYVINTATNDLEWNDAQGELNVIFIAGNEEFTQGPKNYRTSCTKAMKKNITINTIFCGDYENGVRGQWKNGATLTEGKYMNIDMNKKTVYIESPYDDEINKLNTSLNNTYIPFGSIGHSKKAMQLSEDANAFEYGAQNSVQRTLSKSKHVYTNSTWDLVDANKQKKIKLESIESSALPKEMQGLSLAEKKAYIKNKTVQRESIQKQINDLGIKRRKFVEAKRKELGQENSLDAGMIKAIKNQAEGKGFTFVEA